MFGFLKERHRRERRARPFPPPWLATIGANFPYFGRLPPADQAELLGHVQVFLDETTFEGCGGLAIDDTIRVTIAAQACLLLLHREAGGFADLETVLVYPSAYVDPRPRIVEGGVVVEGGQARLGESWTRGVVVLAWDSVLAGAADLRDGHNVVLHELAHQLDQEDGAADGVPALPRPGMYAAWARVLGADFEELARESAEGHRTVMDAYGATNPAEFFAVATEAFFERPRALRAKHPALYEQLGLYYRQDPAALPPARHGLLPDRSGVVDP